MIIQHAPLSPDGASELSLPQRLCNISNRRWLQRWNPLAILAPEVSEARVAASLCRAVTVSGPWRKGRVGTETQPMSYSQVSDPGMGPCCLLEKPQASHMVLLRPSELLFLLAGHDWWCHVALLRAELWSQSSLYTLGPEAGSLIFEQSSCPPSSLGCQGFGDRVG